MRGSVGAMSDPAVRIVFLGGLGEIGRNCFCLEVDDRILVVDCGIMFPDADMPGVDLVLPDFTYLRDNADRVEGVFLTHAHEDHAGGLAFLLRDMRAADLRLARCRSRLARNRIEEAGMLDRTELIPVHRRRAPPHRPVRLPVHPGHALGAARLRDRVLHARGHDHPHRRLQARPHAGRRPPHRPRAARRDRARERRRPAAALRLDERRAPGFTPSESTVGDAMRSLFREHADKRFIVASFASHLHRVQQVAQAAIARRPQDRVRRPVDGAERRDGARARASRRSRVRGHRHRGGARATRRARCASSAPVRRASR